MKLYSLRRKSDGRYMKVRGAYYMPWDTASTPEETKARKWKNPSGTRHWLRTWAKANQDGLDNYEIIVYTYTVTNREAKPYEVKQ